jgi:Cft2 family RNA processing exonuclease
MDVGAGLSDKSVDTFPLQTRPLKFSYFEKGIKPKVYRKPYLMYSLKAVLVTELHIDCMKGRKKSER